MTIKLFNNRDPTVVVRMKDTGAVRIFRNWELSSLLIFIGAQLLHNVVLIYSVQKSESALCTHISPLFWIFFPFSSSQMAGLEFLVLYSRFSLVTYFIDIGWWESSSFSVRCYRKTQRNFVVNDMMLIACGSTPAFRLIPAPLPLPLATRLRALSLWLCFCFASKLISAPFLDSTYKRCYVVFCFSLFDTGCNLDAKATSKVGLMGLSSWHWGSWLQGETWGRQGTWVGCIAMSPGYQGDSYLGQCHPGLQERAAGGCCAFPGRSPGSCTLVKAEESGDTAFGTDLDPEEVWSRGWAILSHNRSTGARLHPEANYTEEA